MANNPPNTQPLTNTIAILEPHEILRLCLSEVLTYLNYEVIIYSNGIQDETFKKALKMGAVACIRKPTGIPALVKVLDHVINVNEPLASLGTRFI